MIVLACVVVAIHTGDMISIKCPNRAQMTVRISAIDAPERNQAWGEKARSVLSDLCLKQLARVTPRTSDAQRRMIADVECRGRDAAQYLVRTGHAWVYDRHAREYGNLYQIEYEARKSRNGLWAERTPMAPWDWRYRQTRLNQKSQQNAQSPQNNQNQRPLAGHQTVTAVDASPQP